MSLAFANRQYWHLAAIAASCFLVYLICMPKVVSLEDSGLFNMVCASGGIGHPPGYPLYSLLCYPFANLPFISTPIGVSMLSALCAAIACTILAAIAGQLVNCVNSSDAHASRTKLAVMWVAGFALAFSEAFWSQAIIQEVYSLNAMLVLGSYYCALRYYLQGQHYQEQHQEQFLEHNEYDSEPTFSQRYLYLCTLCVGLGLSNHWPLLLLAAPGLLLLILPNWRLFSLRLLWALPIIIAVCLLPYLYLWLRSLAYTDISFYGPLDYWQRFWIYISRTGYAGVDASGAGGHRLDFLWWLASQAKLQLGTVGLIFAAVGYAFCWRKLGFFISLALTWLLLSSTIVLNNLLGFSFEPTFQWVFRVYPLQSWAILTLLRRWVFMLLCNG